MLEEKYNEKPYLSRSYSFTGANHQRSVMRLLGMENERVEKSRILEIGCSFGGNIIGTAFYNPECEIVGIDLSKIQVDEGNKIIDEMGLKNIRLHHMNILDYKGEFGKFDYIICHGVYSWVPEDVQDKIMEVISSSLKENGTAAVSYNTYPGWKNLDVLRDISMFRLKMLEKKGEDVNKDNAVAYARGTFDFLMNYGVKESELYKLAEGFSKKEDFYLYHEILEEYNKPIYLYKFNERALKHGLAHVVDAKLRVSNRFLKDGELKENINAEVSGNYIAREQYYDLIFNTGFRVSILTHKDNLSKLSLGGNVEKEHFDSLYLSGRYYYDEKTKKYTVGDVELVDEVIPVIKCLMNKYPSNILVKELVEEVGSEQYGRISNLILDFYVDMDCDKREIENPDKEIKITDRFRKYLGVCLKNGDKITASNRKGENFNVLEIEIMLLFNGENKIDYIKAEIKKIIESIDNKKVSDEFIEKVAKEIKENILLTMEYEEV